MKFYDLKRNTILKTVALLIAVVSLTSTALFGLLWAFGSYNGYNTEDENFFDTNICKTVTAERLWRVGADCFYVPEVSGTAGVSFEKSGLQNSVYNKNNSNIGIEIYCVEDSDENTGADAKGTLVAKTFVPEAVGYEARHDISDEYYIKAYVSQNLTAQDAMYYAEESFKYIQPRMGKFMYYTIFSLLIFLVSIIYLLCSAGYRRGADGVTINVQDKVPYDLYIAICAGVVIFAGVAFVYIYDNFAQASNGYWGDTTYNYNAYIYPAVALYALISAVFIGFLLTSATRFKLGGWWRNTIIYKLVKWLGRILAKVFSGIGKAVGGISLVWKSVTATAVILLGILFLSAQFLWQMAFLLSLAVIAIVMYFSLCMRSLQRAGQELSSGNENYRVDTNRMIWDFKKHGEDLNSIGLGMSKAVAQQMKSERMKTELITNVSHDLKTPLTSIINYVDLLSKEPLEGKAAEYVEVLQRQAERMKKLTEDVVEASKAATGNMSVHLADTDILEIISQASGEYRERLEQKGLELVVKNETGDDNVYISADGRLLWRAIDNLMSNICKYSLENTRVYIDVQKRGDALDISFKNISKNELNISADELMERFVRGDSSRSTEGSGLGLNIARSLIELQGGSLSLAIDGDLFRVDIRFR